MTNAVFLPDIKEIEQLTGTIMLNNASSNFNLDDQNLTKSCAMAQLKQRMTKIVNFDFQNLTKNVLDQKDSNLCVPISVSVLLRWAIKSDLKVSDFTMEDYFPVEKILTSLTMIIYPRSLAGMNLNPKNEEKEFQQGEIELLLKRMKNETYLHKSGWDIIRRSFAEGKFDFNKGKISIFLYLTLFSPSPYIFHAHASLDRHCCLPETRRRGFLPPNGPRPRRIRRIHSPKHAPFVRARSFPKSSASPNRPPKTLLRQFRHDEQFQRRCQRTKRRVLAHDK